MLAVVKRVSFIGVARLNVNVDSLGWRHARPFSLLAKIFSPDIRHFWHNKADARLADLAVALSSLGVCDRSILLDTLLLTLWSFSFENQRRIFSVTRSGSSNGCMSPLLSRYLRLLLLFSLFFPLFDCCTELLISSGGHLLGRNFLIVAFAHFLNVGLACENLL